MHRRHFISSAAALWAAGLSAGSLAATRLPTKRAPSPGKLLKPAQLKRGDLIGLIAPSGATNAAFVEQRVKNLERFGFRVKVSKNILAARGNAAGSPQQRVADLHDMFTDREVRGIWAVRGGSSASQMLPFIDYGLIRRHPKVLVGYSDITALHHALLARAGLVSFHGPVAGGGFTDYSATQLEAVLMHPREQTTFYMAEANVREAEKAGEFKRRTLVPGVAEGPLIGGNLSVMSALVGTPYIADWKGALLFLEDVGEAPYRLDRMLTQLQQARAFNESAGVMFGVFRRARSPEDEPSLTLEQAVDDHLAALKVPSVYGYSFGHIANQFTIPVGIRARLDTHAETVTLLEPAVTERS